MRCVSACAISIRVVTARERHAVADSLRHRDEVGHDVEVLESPVVIARASEAGLHFVGDAETAVLARDLVRFAQVIPRAVRRAADSLNRLGDERRDLARRRVANEFADVVGTLRSRSPPACR